jgi:hypothetical protein
MIKKGNTYAKRNAYSSGVEPNDKYFLNRNCAPACVPSLLLDLAFSTFIRYQLLCVVFHPVGKRLVARRLDLYTLIRQTVCQVPGLSTTFPDALIIG